MAQTKKRKKIIRYRRFHSLNIGTFMFGILFLYMIICIVLYMTTSHITAYEVTSGQLVTNNSYQAIALRSETIYNAEQAGNINYYAGEGKKVAVGAIVYSIDEGGQLSELLEANQSEGNGLTSEEFSELTDTITSYALSYDQVSFHTIYDFKYTIESNLLDYLTANTLNSLDELESQDSSSLFTRSYALRDGIVVYSTDNMEALTIDAITAEYFDSRDYEKQNLRAVDLVKAGDPVYKMVTDEAWSLIIQIDEKQATMLTDLTSVKLKFSKDNMTVKGDFSIINNNGLLLGKIDLNTSMIRYVTDRYVDIELIIDNESGLKIPISAVTEKEFYTIPKEYISYGGNSNEAGFLREIYNEDGTATTEFVTTTIYYQDESESYVDTTTFKEGDYILLSDSQERYQIGKKTPLQGVYNINKGYAVFNQIAIIDQNQEYCIVKDDTRFGLSQYDHIVLDSSAVKESDIVY